MAFNANEFRSALPLGGARPNLFEIEINFPDFVTGGTLAGRQVALLCKASSVPQSTVGTVEVPYFGRTIKFVGDRTYDTWSATIINDEAYTVRRALEDWQNAINQFDFNSFNRQNIEAGGAVGSTANILIKQFTKTGSVAQQYQLKNAWPSEIEAIDLDWGSTDEIEEFGITFNYDYYTIEGPDLAIGSVTSAVSSVLE